MTGLSTLSTSPAEEGDRLPVAGERGRSWILPAKIGISLASLVILALSVDTSRVLDMLVDTAALPFLAAILAFSLQCGLAGLRCRAVVGPAWPIARTEHVRFFWIGQFFNQLLPSTIGGDAIRAWLLSRRGPSLPAAIKFTIVDRLSGVIALLMVMVVLASASAGLAGASASGEMNRLLGLIAGAGIVGLTLALVLLQLRPIKRALRGFRLVKPVLDLTDELTGLVSTPSRAIAVFGLAFAVHGCSIGAFWLSAHAIGEPLGLIEAAVIVPPMLLIAMMPISVAGWGVREGVALVGLGLQGVSPEAAISIALLFGLALLVASLPGSLLWLTRRPPKS